MLPHTGLFLLGKVALQMRIRRYLKNTSKKYRKNKAERPPNQECQAEKSLRGILPRRREQGGNRPRCRAVFFGFLEKTYTRKRYP
ncbi:hypothetical protein GQF38_09290 [Neisseria meningitidis]|nr:hypothetical protein [Neisseria meningitidis]